MRKIPKSFKLFGRTINIKFDRHLMTEKDSYGEAQISQNKITLTDMVSGSPLAYEQMILTFYHEKIHLILDAMGEHRLSRNEKFVELFSNLLMQSDVTEEYEEENLDLCPSLERGF